VQHWSGDRLLLDHHAGADLHLSADTKWIYALIADRIARAWSNDLPVITLRALIDCLNWLKIF
jgi:hypothetical protein